VFKLRNQSEEELNKGLDKLKEELHTLRTQKVSGAQQSKVGRIGVVRKQIAKYLTVINEKVRTAVRSDYANKKRLPLDLRAKKTRALRQQMTKN
jgi:large subunit ribosomal protein L35e